MEYNFKKIEEDCKKFWEEKEIYKVTEDPNKPKYYVLDMFPYPSGAGLHVGHPLGYVANDIYARYKRLKGFNVLHPMGYDAFGLPAEQYAIETGTHPRDTTDKAIIRYREQLDKIGFSFDWSREVKTCEPEYYKWTQWIFLKLFNSWYNREKNKAEPIETLIEKFKNGEFKSEIRNPKSEIVSWDELSEKERQKVLMNYRLAFRSYTEVNWCEALGCVLANDEVKDGKSERGGYPVTRKKMRQWSLRITEYADRLLEGLNRIDWSESLKEQQRNWIGRSEGASLEFNALGLDFTIEVFTTRVDTIFGATFLVIAPEHEFMQRLITREQREEMEKYLAYVKSRSDIERQQEKKITGCFTGSYAVHPFTGRKIPIWTAEYVLAGYGTGAIMAVPADDERDLKFAEKFGLPVIEIIDKSMHPGATIEDKLGKMINSDFLDGMEVVDAIEAMVQRVEEMGIGSRKVNYRMRDASYSRQRYWGEPFPIRYHPSQTLPEGEGLNSQQPKYYTTDGQTWNHNLELAKESRNNPTETEQIIWDRLKNRQTGFKFRRQHPIDKYIPDFVCLQKGLIVEIDGKIHLEQKEQDAERTKDLEKLGFTFIRFTNEEVIANTDEVIKEIATILNKLNDRNPDDEGAVEVSSFGGDLEEVPIALSEKELPLVLPEVDSYKPTGDGRSPLANNKEWVAKGYETDTMPGYAGSSWYFLRYMDAKNPNEFAAKDKIDYWGAVDLYMGGNEHAVGHLLYSRFWCKVLYDLGYVPFDEPFKKLVNQGMIQGVSAYTFRIAETDVFISAKEEKYIDANGDIEDTDFLNDVLFEEFLKRHGRKKSSGAFSYDEVKVSIDLLDQNNCLDIKRFKDWRPEYRNSIFYPEQGFECFRRVEKMSKSKYNVVNPDDVIAAHGADCLRMFEMFLGPIEQSKPWDDKGISGVSNFLRKFWRLFYTDEGVRKWTDDSQGPKAETLRGQTGGVVGEDSPFRGSGGNPSDAELKVLHKTLKKVGEDIEHLSFNTSVSAFMICTNELGSLNCHKRAILEPLVIALSPFAPFITEELWKHLGNPGSVHQASFPKVEEKYLVESTFNYPVSINGKVRAQVNLALDLSSQEVEKQVLAMDVIKKWTNGNAPKKFIFVKGKIINVVV